jgi:hypothetical protein
MKILLNFQLRSMVALLEIILFALETSGLLVLMPRDGPSTITGYPGLNYQAVRFEPLCGNLGTDSRFSIPIDMTDRCLPAVEAFGNNTVDTFGLYDTTGVRLKGSRVGGGYDVCMCFAMAAMTKSLKGNLCIWVDGTGQADQWWDLHLDDIFAGTYRPGSDKSLPFCSDVDLDQVKANWSATAVQASTSESATTVNDRGASSTPSCTYN